MASRGAKGMIGKTQIVVTLLLSEVSDALDEATVKLPLRGRRWIAVYMGMEPGVRVARSTGRQIASA